MRRLLNDYSLFLKEFRRTFHTTGALLPSSPGLGRALARYVAAAHNREPQRGRRILEVGPGTGAVTRHIARRMIAEDRLDLVELNDRFVARLEQLFQHDPQLQPVSPRASIIHAPVQQLAGGEPYDLIVSGLPLNNFAARDVETVLDAFQRLLRSDGTLSFFEYIAVRPVRGLIAGRAEKERLSRISHVLGRLFAEHEIRREAIWINMPPAWVHHVQFEQADPPPAAADAQRTTNGYI
jgi:phospholipid N-methyltransferase